MTINFNKAEFVLSATTQNAFIRDGRPQVTFAGRSNGWALPPARPLR